MTCALRLRMGGCGWQGTTGTCPGGGHPYMKITMTIYKNTSKTMKIHKHNMIFNTISTINITLASIFNITITSTITSNITISITKIYEK